MPSKTAIEWADRTWNPTVGCTKVGNDPACANCYAIPQAQRIQLMGGRGGRAYEGTTVELDGGGLDWSGRVNELPDRLRLPDWRDPSLVFVDSMSDLFHGSVSKAFIAAVFGVIASRPRHIFQILTKRPTRMAAMMADEEFVDLVGSPVWPLPNIWLGTSIGSGAWTERADVLRSIDWPTRFLSLEPLVAPVSIPDWSGLHWVIAGGESITKGGPDAMRTIRAMHPEWVMGIRDGIDGHNRDCPEHPVALLFKQWGNWEPLYNLGNWLDEGGEASEPGVLILNKNGRNTRGTATGSLSNHVGYFADEGGNDEWVFKWRAQKFKGRELDGHVWDGYPPQLTDHMEAHR